MVMRGERQPAGNEWWKATVGRAAADGGSYWRIWCEDCRHAVIVSAEDLIELHGVAAEESFWHLAQRLKCSACDGVRVGIMAASWDRARDLPGRD